MALVVGLLASMVVAAPARAAFAPPYQTTFEIDGNTVVNGAPPTGGADWDNAATSVKGFTTKTEVCTGQNDDTLGSDSLNTLDVLRPVVQQNANVNGKVDLCQAYAAWEAVPVGTEYHVVLYAAWRRNPSETGQASFFVPLVPASASGNADVRLLQFDYQPNTGVTTASLRRFTGSGWNKTLIVAGFEPAVSTPSPAAFGELALDLTRAGVIPPDAPCARFVVPYVFTQTGNSDSALLKDYVGFTSALQIDTCSTVEVTKLTNPAVPVPPANFDVNFQQGDHPTVYTAHLTVPGTPTATLTQVPASPDYGVTETGPPAPWSLRSIVCDAFQLTNGVTLATPVTVTLVANGVPTGQVLPIVPPAYLPGGSGPSARCTVTDEAPSLTLVKLVNSDARPSPTATPDMWILHADGPQSVSVPGSSTGVTTLVAPGTYNLSETRDPGNPPGLSYADGTTWTCDGVQTNSVVVTATSHPVCTITNTATPATLTLVKLVDSTDDPGTPPLSTDFTLSASFQSGEVGETGALDGAGAVTGVTGTPPVTDRRVKRGVYNLSENTIPGYQATWRCVDGNGAVLSTAPQVSIPTVDVGDLAAVLASITVTCTVTNTFTVATLTISGPAVNVVGEAHVFTITVLSGGVTPVPGIVPVLAFVPEGGFTQFTVVNGCLGGTDAAGQCTVTIQATAPGVVAIEGQGLPAPYNVTFDPPVASQKRFRAYQVTGTGSGINFAGQQHTFTLSGVQFVATDGNGAPSGQGPLEAGSIIRFTWAGPGTATGPTVTALGGQAYQCVVDNTGTCLVTVTSAAAATGTLTVTGISVFLDRGDGTTTESSVDYPSPALFGPAPVLTKTWIEVNVTAVPTLSVNLVRQSHTIHFTVTKTVGAAAPTPAGGTLHYTWQTTSPLLIANPPTSCVLDANGECDVVVTSTVLGTGSILVTGVSDIPVDDGVTQTTLSVSTSDPFASSSLTIPATPPTKTWVGFAVALSPTAANNLAGESHVITVSASAFGGPAGPAPGPASIVGAKVDASVIAGSATLNTAASTCVTGAGSDAVGQCTLVYDRVGPGTATIQLDQLRDVTIAGQFFATVPLFVGGSPAPGNVLDLLPVDVQAVKTWWATRVRLDGDSTNEIGVPHTFTATVERSDDGTTWVPVPDGSTLTDTWTVVPPGAAVVDSDTCTAPGTVNGVCHVTVSASAAATGTLTITGAQILIDRNADGVFGEDLNDDGTITPDELGDDLATVTPAQLTDSLLTAVKQWVVPGTRSLSVTKTDDVAPGSAVLAGSTFSYLLTVENTGTLPLTGVTVSDVLPAALTLVSATPGTGWTCPSAPVGTAGAAVSCEHADPIAPAEQLPVVTLVVRLAATYTATSIRNVATAIAPGPPPIEAQATLDTPTAVAPAELPVTGAASLPPIGLAFLLILTGLALMRVARYQRRRNAA